VESGQTLSASIDLAHQLAEFPQRCMRSDRLSSYRQWNLDGEAALALETRLGLETISSGEIFEGVKRFSDGAGRHGRF
jgi:enoyl-CoA hydratase